MKKQKGNKQNVTKNSNLGKALQNHLRKKAFVPVTVDQPLFIHQNLEGEQRKQILSVIDQDNLEEFLTMAQMADKNFQAQRGTNFNPQEIDGKKEIKNDYMEKKVQYDPAKQFNLSNNQALKKLRIPRRPKWEKMESADELHRAENLAFLEWRRGLAQIEEKFYDIQITPYEKNIDVWRQLWRTVEKSDILVQIVDGRDPLFYRCEDVDQYVHEIDSKKLCFLLINKSDLLSDDIRIEWNKYFLEKGVMHMFFSAKKEQDNIDNQKGNTEHILFDQMEEQQVKELINTHHIASRKELLYSLQKVVRVLRQNKLQQLQTQIEEKHEKVEVEKQYKTHLVTVGMVGYPNVGKSSVINTLCNRKLVGVASQPGKTKHIQTLFLDDELMVCDCPGLVFPNAASTRGEMVCNGVLPIDKIRDYLSPIDVLAERIPKIVFEKFYGLKLEIPNDPRLGPIITSSQVLSAYATKHNFFAQGSGLPEMAKASKIMLKDFVNGKLLFCKLPPNFDNSERKIWQSNLAFEKDEELLKQKLQSKLNILKELGQEEEEKKEELSAQDQKFLDVSEQVVEVPDLTNENLIELMEGKKVQGIKLTKEQRRDIKHRLQRGEELDYKEYLSHLQAQFKESGFKNKNFKNLPSVNNDKLN